LWLIRGCICFSFGNKKPPLHTAEAGVLMHRYALVVSLAGMIRIHSEIFAEEYISYW
jgi:hypothetical protein